MTVRPVVAASVALAIACAGAVAPAYASGHQMLITEVFAGTPRLPDAQLIELTSYKLAQTFTQHHHVRVFDADGRQVGRFPIGRNVLNGADQAAILFATPSAAALFGVTPDVVIDPVLTRRGGAACYEHHDCISWGNYRGATELVGQTFNPSEGLILSASATRVITRGEPARYEPSDDSGNSRNDFLAKTPTPRNNAGAGGSALPCSVTFQHAALEASEAAPSVEVTVMGCAGATVAYAAAGISAREGEDFAPASGVLTFAPGDLMRTFTVRPVNDAAYEGDETVRLTLRDAEGAYLTAPDAVLTLTESSIRPTRPRPPRALTAEVRDGGAVHLSWIPPDGGEVPRGYVVYRGHASGSQIPITAVGGTSAVDAPGDGVSRYYTVRAEGVHDVSLPSNEVVVTTAPLPAQPTAPEAFAATGGVRRIDVSWAPPTSDGGSPVLGYRVYEGASPHALALVVDLDAGATQLTRMGVADGATRYWRVLAHNAAGDGVLSATISATAHNVPDAPRALSASAGDGTVTLSWLPPGSDGGAPVSGFRIWRGAAGGDEVPIATVGAVTSFTDTGLPRGATRTYRVSAINAVGEGPLATATSTRTFSVPDPPVGVRATSGAMAGEVAVRWETPAWTGGTQLTEYVVYRFGGGAPESEIARTPDPTFVDRGLQLGTRFYYRIAAVNAIGEGEPSAIGCARPFPWLDALGCAP